MTLSTASASQLAVYFLFTMSLFDYHGAISLTPDPGVRLKSAEASLLQTLEDGVNPSQMHTDELFDRKTDTLNEDSGSRKEGIYVPLTRKVKAGAPTHGVVVGDAGIVHKRMDEEELRRRLGEDRVRRSSRFTEIESTFLPLDRHA